MSWHVLECAQTEKNILERKAFFIKKHNPQRPTSGPILFLPLHPTEYLIVFDINLKESTHEHMNSGSICNSERHPFKPTGNSFKIIAENIAQNL